MDAKVDNPYYSEFVHHAQLKEASRPRERLAASSSVDAKTVESSVLQMDPAEQAAFISSQVRRTCLSSYCVSPGK